MSLLAYNLTIAPLALPGVAPPTSLPASLSAGSRGPALNVTGELKPLTALQFAALQAQVDLGLVQYNWTGAEEYPTPGLTVISSQTSESNIIHAATTGNDTNEGTPASPLLTVKAVWDKMIATPWTKQSKGYFLPGTYTLRGSDAVGAYVNSEQNRAITGTPPALIGGFTNELGDKATTSADPTRKLVIDTGLAMVVDEYIGATILWLPGSANAGTRNQVRSNTATTLVLAGRAGNPILANDPFRVERPSVTFAIPAGEAVVFGYGNQYLALAGIKFSLGVGSALLFVDDVHPVCMGVEFDLGFEAAIFNSGAILQDANDGPWSTDGVDNPFIVPSGGGCFFHDGFLGYGNGTLFKGAHVFRNIFCVNFFNTGGNFDLYPVLKDTSLLVQTDSFLNITGPGSNPGSVDGTDPFSISTSPIVVDDSRADVGPLVITNAAGPCVLATNRSPVACNGLSGSTGNLDVGIQADGMSQVSANGCTVTGVAGDTRVGVVPKAYGALPFSEVDGSGPTLNRIAF
jgi:hypothetical protein